MPLPTVAATSSSIFSSSNSSCSSSSIPTCRPCGQRPLQARAPTLWIVPSHPRAAATAVPTTPTATPTPTAPPSGPSWLAVASLSQSATPTSTKPPAGTSRWRRTELQQDRRRHRCSSTTTTSACRAPPSPTRNTSTTTAARRHMQRPASPASTATTTSGRLPSIPPSHFPRKVHWAPTRVVGGGYYHKVTNFTLPTTGYYYDPYYGLRSLFRPIRTSITTPATQAA